MKRRDFLRYSVAAAITVPGIVSLTGCGGGGGSSGTSSTLSSADTQVAAINNEQQNNDTLFSQTSTASSNLLSGTSGQSTALLTAAAGTLPTSPLFSGFQEKTLKLNSLSANSSDAYFAEMGGWENILQYHDDAYEQAAAQLTKLKASLRLYGYKESTSSQSAAVQSAAVQNAALSDLVNALNQAIEDFKNAEFGKVAVDGLIIAVEAVKLGLELLQNTAGSYTYIALAFSAIQGILRWIETKSLQNFSFASNSDTLLSLAKLSIAVMSVLGIASLEKLKTSSSTALADAVTGMSAEEEQQLSALLQSISLQSQLVLTLSTLINGIMGNVSTATQERVTALKDAIDNTDGTYTLTQEDLELIDTLKQQSMVLAAVGLVMKVLLSFYQAGFSAVTSDDVLQNDAQTYALLFGDPVNAYDTIFSGFTFENFTALFENNTTIQQLIADLAALNPNFLVSTTTEAISATSTAESGAVDFASMMANLSYQFTSNTATQAYDFATHMADLAYQFTMKIEDDAYNFAMQGMEYGYLFASRGEEVGLMADRILWMAVQIGVMADRIGEMADRIVYTEQLIVYTEMLILDFGLLIYGGMKQISNVMLMGMAIVFDRQWYSPSVSDPIVETIGAMTTQMLQNMQDYALTVLENQTALRNTTLEALNWISGEY